MTRCRTCNEPIVFLPLVGWQHLTFTGLDHEAKEKR